MCGDQGKPPLLQFASDSRFQIRDQLAGRLKGPCAAAKLPSWQQSCPAAALQPYFWKSFCLSTPQPMYGPKSKSTPKPRNWLIVGICNLASIMIVVSRLRRWSLNGCGSWPKGVVSKKPRTLLGLKQKPIKDHYCFQQRHILILISLCP